MQRLAKNYEKIKRKESKSLNSAGTCVFLHMSGNPGFTFHILLRVNLKFLLSGQVKNSPATLLGELQAPLPLHHVRSGLYRRRRPPPLGCRGARGCLGGGFGALGLATRHGAARCRGCRLGHSFRLGARSGFGFTIGCCLTWGSCCRLGTKSWPTRTPARWSCEEPHPRPRPRWKSTIVSGNGKELPDRNSRSP